MYFQIQRAARRSIRQAGTTLFLGVMSMCLVIPMIGMAIDVGYLYAVKARLQGAVDGASLAAARSLNLGLSITQQQTSAKQNALNWFYGNFPVGSWQVTNIQMDSTDTHVHVYDDMANPQLQHVDVTATVDVPTYFMKWFNFGATRISAIGNATRRDVVAMLVLDRSSSMLQSSGACQDLKDAAKIFTGQFAAGRDRIGLISFSDGTFVHSAPSTTFRTTLGYTQGSTSVGGAIDTIQCGGTTASAQAISLAYNELYKVALPGALNIILFESDGLPNTMTMDLWDTSTSSSLLAAPGGGAGCTDTNGKKKGQAGSPVGWSTLAVQKPWSPTATYSMGGTNPGYMPDVVNTKGPIASLFANDPGNGQTMSVYYPFHSSGNSTTPFNSGTYSGRVPGCQFTDSATNSTMTDFGTKLPGKDIWGNSVSPSNAYKSVTMNGNYLDFTGSAAVKWANFRNGAFNATDNAAYRSRVGINLSSGTPLQTLIYVVGLGGNGSDPPDFTLMQRIANDADGDHFNSPAKYQPCASTTGCVHYTDQPQGTFIFSANHSALGRAFLELSSQILRLQK